MRLYEDIMSYFRRRVAEGTKEENLTWDMLPGHLKREISDYFEPQYVQEKKKEKVDKARAEKQAMEDVLRALKIQRSKHSFVSGTSDKKYPWDMKK